MTHKLIISLMVLCSTIGLCRGSLVSAAPASLSLQERTLIQSSLPLIDLSNLVAAPIVLQKSILKFAQDRSREKLVREVEQTPKKLVVNSIPKLPFYSQFSDISSPTWQKVSCGIASIAMVIDHYSDKPIDPNSLLKTGLASGSYIESAGWSHQGLIDLAKPYGLSGETIGLSHLSIADAFMALSTAVTDGPVIASVHYTFEPTNPIPHLVVVTGVADNVVHYSDPAEPTGNQTISAEKFKAAWKKRYIVVRKI